MRSVATKEVSIVTNVRSPYPVTGTVTEPLGTAVPNATVNVIYQGDKLTATTNSSGQYVLDLANLPSANNYTNGIRFRIEAYSSNLYYSTTSVVSISDGSLELDIALQQVNSSNMHTLVQKTIFNILNSDNMMNYFGANIKDQIPPDLTRGAGFPYIIVNSPTISEDKLTLGWDRKFKDKIFVEIEIYDKIQKNVREVGDAVRSALMTNQNITRQSNLYWMRVSRSTLSHAFYAGEETYPIWTLTLGIEFFWVGT